MVFEFLSFTKPKSNEKAGLAFGSPSKFTFSHSAMKMNNRVILRHRRFHELA